jgi:hypothetical protein
VIEYRQVMLEEQRLTEQAYAIFANVIELIVDCRGSVWRGLEPAADVIGVRTDQGAEGQRSRVDGDRGSGQVLTTGFTRFSERPERRHCISTPVGDLADEKRHSPVA